jgi:hypothetical protein
MEPDAPESGLAPPRRGYKRSDHDSPQFMATVRSGSGSNYQHDIRFVSLSLSQERLEQVVEPLTRELQVFRNVDALQEIEPPKISEGLPGPPGKTRWTSIGRPAQRSGSRFRNPMSRDRTWANTGWKTCTSSSGPSATRQSAGVQSGGSFPVKDSPDSIPLDAHEAWRAAPRHRASRRPQRLHRARDAAKPVLLEV